MISPRSKVMGKEKKKIDFLKDFKKINKKPAPVRIKPQRPQRPQKG